MQKKNKISTDAHHLLLIIAAAAIIISLALFSSCSPRRGYTRMAAERFASQPSLVQGPFNKIWNEWSIMLVPETGGVQSPSFMSPMGGRGRGRGMPGMFELSVRATLMDSAVINAGIDLFAEIADMTPEEKTVFRDHYDEEHFIGKYLFIWADLRTPYSNEYLKLNRWTFFLETESGQQIEPVKVVSGDSLNIAQRGRGFRSRMPSQNVEFYFPLTDHDGKPLLSPQNGSLKFAVVSVENKDKRAEGEWNLKALLK